MTSKKELNIFVIPGSSLRGALRTYVSHILSHRDRDQFVYLTCVHYKEDLAQSDQRIDGCYDLAADNSDLSSLASQHCVNWWIKKNELQTARNFLYSELAAYPQINLPKDNHVLRSVKTTLVKSIPTDLKEESNICLAQDLDWFVTFGAENTLLILPEDSAKGGGKISDQNQNQNQNKSQKEDDTNQGINDTIRQLIQELIDNSDILSDQRDPEEKQRVIIIGEKIRSLRQEKGYSRRQLAEQLEFNFALLVALENGDGAEVVANYVLKQLENLPPVTSR